MKYSEILPGDYVIYSSGAHYFFLEKPRQYHKDGDLFALCITYIPGQIKILNCRFPPIPFDDISLSANYFSLKYL